jgi:tetratricopeptide (TPR) repeat protein
LVNLGSVAYLEGDFGGALDAYQNAVNRIESGARVRDDVKSTAYLNLAKTAYRLEQYTDAREYYSEAAAINPDRAAEYAYIGSAQSTAVQETGVPDGARASDAAEGPPILFAD